MSTHPDTQPARPEPQPLRTAEEMREVAAILDEEGAHDIDPYHVARLLERAAGLLDDATPSERVPPSPEGEEPRCGTCGAPATCYGSYEGQAPDYGCDDCCGHGNEDGWCTPDLGVAARPASPEGETGVRGLVPAEIVAYMEEVLGIGHRAWDTVDPQAIVLAVLQYISESEAPAPPEGVPLDRSDEFAELRRLAEAATPGPWVHGPWEDRRAPFEIPFFAHDQPQGERWIGSVQVLKNIERGNANAAFIAAANPSAVLALLAALQAVRERVETAERALEVQTSVSRAIANDGRGWANGFERERVRAERAEERVAKLERERDEARSSLAWAMKWIPAQYEPMCRYCGSNEYASATDDTRVHKSDCEWAAARHALGALSPRKETPHEP